MAENQVALINTRKSMSPVKPAQIVVYSSRKICKYVREERDRQILFDSQNKISKKKKKLKPYGAGGIHFPFYSATLFISHVAELIFP